jgi:NAD(P)H-dependent FMN reductase
MATEKVFKVGIIIGSHRVVRVGPQIARFVLDILQTAEADKTSRDTTSTQAPKRPSITFDLVDLTTHNLPLFDEPIIPQAVKSADGYSHGHTRAWSRRVAGLDAFVFVAPQHNWSIPAGLKNAIDYLFHEWRGKPATIVTYGGHGGTRCAEHLRTVLGSIGVRVADKAVALAFPSPEFRGKCFRGEELGLDAGNDAGPWAEKRGEILVAWKEVVDMLASDAIRNGV